MAEKKMTMTLDELEEAIFEQKKPFAEIAREQGVSRQCVEALAKKNFGYACSTSRKIAEETDNAIKVYKKVQSIQKTSEITGITTYALIHRFRKVGFKYSNRKRWTPENIEMIKQMRAEGKKHREIAEYFDTTPSNIMTALYVRTEERKPTKLTGLPREEIMKQARENEKQVKSLLKKGKTAEEISKQVGISIPRIYQIAKQVEEKAGINKRRTKGQARATRELVRSLKQHGSSYKDISEQMGMKITQVYAIVKKIKKEEEAC